MNVAVRVFFIVTIPTRRWLYPRQFTIRLWQFAFVGAIVGFLTGILLSTGSLSAPAFTAYGLTKGAFLSTEATSSLMLTISKVVTFQQVGALPIASVARGFIIGTSVMVGSFLGRIVVQRMSVHAFRHILDAAMLCLELSLLLSAAN